MLMTLIAQKIKLEKEIEDTIARIEEIYGKIPEEYLEDVMHFYELREVWDVYLTELMKDWKEDLEE